MEVILSKDVDKIGKAGSVVKVKDGFGRNFLIPNGLAVPLTSANLKILEQEKTKLTLQAEKARKAAEELKAKLANLSLTMSVLTQEGDKLYGSITAPDIIAALKEEGFEIDKTCLTMAEPIKALGIYEVPVKLHPEISVNIKVWIVKK
jgi:large subunit ribosomal protein L9